MTTKKHEILLPRHIWNIRVLGNLGQIADASKMHLTHITLLITLVAVRSKVVVMLFLGRIFDA